MLIRTSVKIGGSRLSDHDFSSLSLDQRMGGHHFFEIRLSENVQKDMLMEKTQAWLGKQVSFGFDYHKDIELDAIPVKELFKGIVTSIELSRARGSGHIVVKGHSPTIVMDDGPMTQSFTQAGLQEIVDKVISPYSKVFPEKLSISPVTHRNPIDYTVQYNENAFNFINRLANRYGEWFFYDGLNMYFGEPPSGNAIPLDFDANGLSFLDISLKAYPVQLELKAYDYRSHKAISAKVPEKSPTNKFGNIILAESKSIFSENATRNFQSDLEKPELDQLAKRNSAAATENMVVLNGVSTNCYLVPGAVVDIQDKALDEKFGEYTITAVSHVISQGGEYSNNFQAIPNEVKIPPHTANPKAPFCETQLGIVSAVDDPESLGRIQVELNWQESTGETTPWIRVSSPYTGKDKGFYVIPEVGDQVLVSFEDSNPEKPFVLAGIYHGKAKPELFSAKNDIKGFKSREDNKLQFNDKEKSILLSAHEKLELVAGKEIVIKTEKKGTMEIDLAGGELTIKVGKVKIEATGAIDITSSGGDIKQEGVNISSKAKANLENSAGAKLDVKAGAQLDLKGSAMVKIAGGIVQIN